MRMIYKEDGNEDDDGYLMIAINLLLYRQMRRIQD